MAAAERIEHRWMSGPDDRNIERGEAVRKTKLRQDTEPNKWQEQTWM